VSRRKFTPYARVVPAVLQQNPGTFIIVMGFIAGNRVALFACSTRKGRIIRDCKSALCGEKLLATGHWKNKEPPSPVVLAVPFREQVRKGASIRTESPAERGKGP